VDSDLLQQRDKEFFALVIFFVGVSTFQSDFIVKILKSLESVGPTGQNDTPQIFYRQFKSTFPQRHRLNATVSG
jgi:hypothetical protein